MSTFLEKKNNLVEETVGYIWSEDDSQFHSEESRACISREIDDMLLLDNHLTVDDLTSKCIVESLQAKQRKKSIERTRKYQRLYHKYMPLIGEDLWDGYSWLAVESKYPIKKTPHDDSIHSGYNFTAVPEITFGDTYIVKSVISYLQESHLFYGLKDVASANEISIEEYLSKRIGLDIECIRLALRNLGIRF